MATQTKAISIPAFSSAQQFRINFAIGLLAVISMAIFCQFASGQVAPKAYKQIDIDEKYREVLPPIIATADDLKQNRTDNRVVKKAISTSEKQVDAILESNGNFADPIVAEFFETYVFPSMTQTDNRNLSSMGINRTQFIKDFLNKNVRGNVRTNMIDLTIRETQKIYEDKDLHPSARLNAVYILGLLDDVPAIRIDNQIPVPSKAAYAGLGSIIVSADADKHPEFLKVAALAGIQRHVEIDQLAGGQIDAGQKANLITILGNLLNKPENDDLAYWLKRRSMQIVGLIGDSGSVDTALAIIKSPDGGIWLKMDAVEAISKLDMVGAGADKSLEASVAIAEFVGKALEAESKSIEAAVAKLVFDSLLFQNIDLEATGTNYESDAAIKTGAPGAAGGGSSGRGGIGGAGLAGGLGTPGLGSGPTGGVGSSGGRGITSADVGIKLELPGYQLNLIRRRIKSLAFTGSNVLGGETGEDGLKRIVAANDQEFVKKAIEELNYLLDKSNVGIIDLDNLPEPPAPGSDPPPTVTRQLINFSAESAGKLLNQVQVQKGDPGVDDLAAPATQPSGGTPVTTPTGTGN